MAPREPGGRRDRTGRGAPDGHDDARIHDRRWGGVRDIRWIPGPAPGRLDGALPWPRAGFRPIASCTVVTGVRPAVFPVSVSLPAWGLEAETSSGNGTCRCLPSSSGVAASSPRRRVGRCVQGWPSGRADEDRDGVVPVGGSLPLPGIAGTGSPEPRRVGVQPGVTRYRYHRRLGVQAVTLLW